MKQHTTGTIANSPPGTTPPGLKRLRALAAAGLALAASAAPLVSHAQTQAAEPAAAPASTASAPAPAASTTTFYDPKDLERAFKFMDKTGDGKISRDEASNFRGVSKHFDEADTNKDGFLSREEFDNAMNKSIKNKAP